MMAVSVVTGSMATFISIIGFSEFLAFLPMINLEYTAGLKFFFRGISGVNFQFYDAASWLEFLDLPKTAGYGLNEGYEDAGFDNVALFLGTADITLICLISFVNYSLYRLGLLFLGRFKFWRNRFKGKL